jgi:glycerol-3-phosphate cytidylyltransferase
MRGVDSVKKYKIGYTTGVFDLFHVGHLNILKKAKEQCDFLIVGVTVDELVSYKNKQAFIPYEDRFSIIESIKYVDKVVAQESMNKMDAWHRYCFDVIFVGDDWKGTDKWNSYEREFKPINVDIVYIPYTKKISSTKIREKLQNKENQERDKKPA